MEGLRKYLCCLVLLSLAMQGLGSVGKCKPSFQFIPGPPGRDGSTWTSNGAPGPQGRDGIPGITCLTVTGPQTEGRTRSLN